METKERAIALLRRRAARDRLESRQRLRDIVVASESGLSQRQISDLLGTSQPTVQRILKRLDNDRSGLTRGEQPADVIDRGVVGEISRQEMMRSLLEWNYTFGQVPQLDGVVTDAYEPGTWDQVTSAYYREVLTDNEFERLVERNKKNLESAARGQ